MDSNNNTEDEKFSKLTGRENLLEEYGLLEEYQRLRKIDKGLPMDREKILGLKRKYFEPRASNKIPYYGLKALANEVLLRNQKEGYVPPDLSLYIQPLSEQELREGFILTDVPIPKRKRKSRQ